jgi:hypothetical protein
MNQWDELATLLFQNGASLQDEIPLVNDNRKTVLRTIMDDTNEFYGVLAAILRVAARETAEDIVSEDDLWSILFTFPSHSAWVRSSWNLDEDEKENDRRFTMNIEYDPTSPLALTWYRTEQWKLQQSAFWSAVSEANQSQRKPIRGGNRRSHLVTLAALHQNVAAVDSLLTMGYHPNGGSYSLAAWWAAAKQDSRPWFGKRLGGRYGNDKTRFRGSPAWSMTIPPSITPMDIALWTCSLPKELCDLRGQDLKDQYARMAKLLSDRGGSRGWELIWEFHILAQVLTVVIFVFVLLLVATVLFYLFLGIPFIMRVLYWVVEFFDGLNRDDRRHTVLGVVAIVLVPVAILYGAIVPVLFVVGCLVQLFCRVWLRMSCVGHILNNDGARGARQAMRSSIKNTILLLTRPLWHAIFRPSLVRVETSPAYPLFRAQNRDTEIRLADRGLASNVVRNYGEIGRMSEWLQQYLWYIELAEQKGRQLTAPESWLDVARNAVALIYELALRTLYPDDFGGGVQETEGIYTGGTRLLGEQAEQSDTSEQRDHGRLRSTDENGQVDDQQDGVSEVQSQRDGIIRQWREAGKQGRKFGLAMASFVTTLMITTLVKPLEMVIRGGDALGRARSRQERHRIAMRVLDEEDDGDIGLLERD